MLSGIVVLSLILILWLRERIYEIGILLSIGISKIKIITQFILELIFISLPTTIVSLCLGGSVKNVGVVVTLIYFRALFFLKNDWF